MKRFLILAVWCWMAIGAAHAQSIIANQQLTLGGQPLKLTTYEHTSDGYKNTLALENAPESAEVTSLDFFLLTLDADQFYNRFWIAADSLLPGQTHDQGDFPTVAGLFGGIVLAANSSDDRPLAGRLILSKRALALKAGEDYSPKRPRYFVRYNKLQQFHEFRKEQDQAYTVINGIISTSTERKEQVLKEQAAHVAKRDGLQDSLVLTQKRVLVLTADMDQFAKSPDRKRFEDLRDSTQAQVTSMEALLAGKASPKDSTTLARIGVLPGKLDSIDSYLSARKATLQRTLRILSEDDPTLVGGGRRTQRDRLQAHAAHLQRSIGLLDSLLAQNTRLLDTLDAYISNASSVMEELPLLEIDSVRIEFNQGMMERIVASAHLLHPDGSIGDALTLTSIYPIGFSTIRNFSQTLSSQMLVDLDDDIMLPLADLVNYLPNLRLNTRDFSPADTAMTFFPDVSEYLLRKESRADVLRARIYSDFVGLSEAEPNGLVQTELEKRINLYTWRRPICRGTFLNTSLFQYVKPIATLSKLDGKLRSAPLSVAPTQLDSLYLLRPHMRTIDLLRYESMSAGLDLNLWLLDSQPWKMTLFANLGARFGRVSVMDSLRTYDSLGVQTSGIVREFGVNTFRLYPELQVGIFPDETFNIFVSYRPTYLRLLSDDFAQVPNTAALLDPETREEDLEDRWIHTFELAATVRLSDRGELYARYRLHLQDNAINTNFHQAQVGYAIQLTKKVAGE